MASISLSIKSLETKNTTFKLKRSDTVTSLQKKLQDLKIRVEDPKPDSSISTSSNSGAEISLNKDQTVDVISWLLRIEIQIDSLRKGIKLLETDQQLVTSLWFESFSVRHDNVALAHQETFSWIFKGSLPDGSAKVHFSEWLMSGSKTFWINGKAGSGKSTLMKFLYSHPETLGYLNHWAAGHQLITAHFFFWRSGTDLQKSQNGLLRSLLFEILRQCPELLEYARIIRAQFSSSAFSWTSVNGGQRGTILPDSFLPWSRDELLLVYQSLTLHKSSSRFCFFIDGLDEYVVEGARDHRDLVATLQLLGTSPYIKFCVSSRPWTVFSDAFGIDKERVLQLELLTKGDIQQYVNDKFIQHSQFEKLAKTDPGYFELIEDIVSKAQGVFLWVYLIVRDLLKGLTYHDSVQTMRLRIRYFPPDLESYFQHMINSIPPFYYDQTAQMFQTALSSPGPLLLATYMFLDEVTDNPAVSCDDVPSMIGEGLEGRYDTMRRRLDGRCQGLLEIVTMKDASNDLDRYKVDFLHRTVRDYLERGSGAICEQLTTVELNGQLWVKLCHASIMTVKALVHTEPRIGHDGFQRAWDELFHFVCLVQQISGNLSSVDPIIDEADNFHSPQGVLITIDEILRLGSACQYGLVQYIKRKIPDKYNGNEMNVAKLLMPSALLQCPLTRPLYPELVSYLLGFLDPSKLQADSPCPASLENHGKIGFSPTKADLLEDINQFLSIFISRIADGRVSPKHEGVLEVLKLLLAHGADPEGRGPMGHPSPRDVIRERFPEPHASWLMDGNPEKDVDKLLPPNLAPSRHWGLPGLRGKRRATPWHDDLLPGAEDAYGRSQAKKSRRTNDGAV